MSSKDSAVQRIREFNRFYMPLLRLLDNHYLGSEYTPAEARVLFEVYQNDGCTAAFIVREMNINKSYVSRIVRAHEKKGYLTRSACAADGRAYQLHLTEEGIAQTQDFIAKSNRQIGQLIQSLQPEECARLVAALDDVTAILNGCGKENVQEDAV